MMDSAEPGGMHRSLRPASSSADNLARVMLAEAVGTFLLVLVGTAVAIAATLGKNTAGPAYNSLAVALSFGLILIPIVGALGQVSGAHVNPAVTIGLAVVRRFPWRYVPAYVVAQFAGAVLASLAVWAAYGHGAYHDAHLGLPSPVHGTSKLQVLLVEALIAFMLVLTVIATATDPRVPAGTAAVSIGFALAAGVLLGGPVSGGAGNPARALAPMIVTGLYPVWSCYTAGPLIGGVLAALLYRLIHGGSAPAVTLADQSADDASTRPHGAFIPPMSGSD